jgi:excisionase family DNA binding protein
MAKRQDGHLDLPVAGKVMTLTEVAEHLRIHRITVYRMLKAEVQLGQMKIGPVWRFDREHVMRFASKPQAQSIETQDGSVTENQQGTRKTFWHQRTKINP